MEWSNQVLKDLGLGIKVAAKGCIPFLIFFSLIMGIPLILIWQIWIGIGLAAAVALGIGATALTWVGQEKRYAMEKQRERTPDSSTGVAA